MVVKLLRNSFQGRAKKVVTLRMLPGWVETYTPVKLIKLFAESLYCALETNIAQ